MCLLPDFPKLYDVSVSVKVDRKINRATVMPEGIEIAFSQKDGVLNIEIPPFRLHTLIVLE